MSSCNDVTQIQSKATEFNSDKADQLHKLIATLSGHSVQAAISWRRNSETAVVAFQLKDAAGILQYIRIHGEYFKLREQLSHHLGGRHV